MTVFIAQPSQESQVGYLRFRFPNIRSRMFILGFVLLFFLYIYYLFLLLLYIFFTMDSKFLIMLNFLYLSDRNHVAPRLSLN